MKVTRIFTGTDGQSHLEDLDIPMAQSAIGALTKPIAAQSVIFRDTAQGGPQVLDFHVAPRRQFVIHVTGRVEIECGDGTAQQFGAGDLLLADDTMGQGHISREIQGPRLQVFVPLDPSVDIEQWRAR